MGIKINTATLVRVRKVHRLSGTALAERVGISRNYLSIIEAGKRNPSLKLLDKLAEVFGETAVSRMIEDRQDREIFLKNLGE